MTRAALSVVPVTLAEARRFVADHHRHNEPPIGHRFSIGLADEAGTLVGVCIASRPVARGLDDGRTLELIRLTTDGTRNACSRLYAAACRAAFAMGYRRIVTYTLADEPGSSLRAAGFAPVEVTRQHAGWVRNDGVVNSVARLRLFDAPKMPDGPKQRWERVA